VLHVEVQDPNGGHWKLATQDADWSPSDPSQLIGHLVEDADLDENTGELRLALSGGSSFNVVPGEQEAEDDPPSWKLFTPESLVLVFGPGGQWQFNRADEPVGLPLGPDALSNARVAESEALAATLAREVLASRDEQFLFLAVGLSIVSIAVAVVSLAFALQ